MAYSPADLIKQLFFEADESSYDMPVMPSPAMNFLFKCLSCQDDLELLEIAYYLVANACVEDSYLAEFLRQNGNIYDVMKSTVA